MDYPRPIAKPGHVEPCPRRIRGVLAGRTVVDTVRALYVWDGPPPYPQYYVPIDDLAADVLIDEGTVQQVRRGAAHVHGLRVGDKDRPASVRVFGADSDRVDGYARLDWAALDAWFEEDEQVFVHPRDPFSRVDVVRSRRSVRVELDGTMLADSDATVFLFETGLPTRYYFDRTEVRFEHLRHTDTQTQCPYKGITSDYWSAVLGDTVHEDIAWSYNFTTAVCLPIAGLVAFFNERVDVFVDGELLERPITAFSPRSRG
ncbi:MAG TPA: DUF427 domain-containing protein [Jatrophihabitantaceae bacterium]|nr:DUF427 domain-containing protein [Jatrophihabitantaceae bacterium]